MTTELLPDHCVSDAAANALEELPARTASIGALEIRRLLPRSARRMVGAWCFLDRYGPLTFTSGAPMDLAPHPHIGLQTVSWLLEGELLHRDSIGSENVLRPGGINLMTSGAGIAHSEETPDENSGRLNGVQLWIALPDGARGAPPSFGYYPQVTIVEERGGSVGLLLGEMAGAKVAAPTFSPLVAADVTLRADGRLVVPLRADFEHALLVTHGRAQLEGVELVPDILYYVGTRREALELSSRDGGRLLVVGGVPFTETILMWWNFVARTQAEIVAAAEDWNAFRRFGEVRGYAGPRIPTPPLRGRMRPPAAS
jgi:quercetin 2,3-dioxygenase